MGVTSLSFAKLDLGSVNNLNCFWLPCSNKMTPSKRKMTHNIDYVSACLKVMPIILSSSRLYASSLSEAFLQTLRSHSVKYNTAKVLKIRS